ncbi:MAG: NlpC/P60 family protein [Syntrophomonas sp.]
MLKKLTATILCLLFLASADMVNIPVANAATSTYVSAYKANYPTYAEHEIPIVNAFHSGYNGSLAQAIVGRAIWYMEYGYMIYGHEKYPTSGLIDCSNFVSLVYKDFGYSITSAARNYGTVGTKVSGVYSKLQTGSKTKYTLVGVDNLRPGDIFTFWNTDSNGNRYISHVALYMGKINGVPTIIQTVKGRPTAIGITNSFTYWYGEHFNGARRVLTSSDQVPQPSGVKLPNPVIPSVYKLSPQAPIVLPDKLQYGFYAAAPGSDSGTEPATGGTTGNTTTDSTYVQNYKANYSDYLQHEIPLMNALRSSYNNSLAQAIIGRAIWYMEYGYMIYGYSPYATSGLIDSSDFVSMVFKDFGYNLTTSTRNYNTVGNKVSGVYSKLQTGSKTKYKLVGVDNLQPGDIFTYWSTNSNGNRYISHVAIYMGKINGVPAIIHTIKGRPTAIGITTSFTYWYGQHLNSVRRVLPSSAQVSQPDGIKLPSSVIPSVYKLTPQAPIVLPSNLPSGF